MQFLLYEPVFLLFYFTNFVSFLFQVKSSIFIDVPAFRGLPEFKVHELQASPAVSFRLSLRRGSTSCVDGLATHPELTPRRSLRRKKRAWAGPGEEVSQALNRDFSCCNVL